MLKIDGSFGEGGGQILRSSLGLSMVTGQPFLIENIRGNRRKPGLLRQHLTAVRAATAICSARVEGDELRSSHLKFSPGPVKSGNYQFSIGTAGSTTLVLQAILPALLTADGSSQITLEGGTHNPMAPPFDFIERAFLPLVNRMGPRVEARLERYGFNPAGGGCIVVDIEPVDQLKGFEMMTRGEITRRHARAVVVNLDRGIAKRELRTVQKKMDWEPQCLEVKTIERGHGVGNVLTLEVESAARNGDGDGVTEIFTGFGAVNCSAEQVASGAVKECRRYLNSTAPIGEHLADQIMLPLALARSGGFRATRMTGHTETHAELIQRFLETRVEIKDVGRDGIEMIFH